MRCCSADFIASATQRWDRYNSRCSVKLCLSVGGRRTRQARCKWNQWHQAAGCETGAPGSAPQSLVTVVLQRNKGCGVDRVVLIRTLCPALSRLQKKRLSWSRLCWRTCCRPRWGATTATRAPWPRRPAAKWWSGSSSADPSTSRTNRWEVQRKVETYYDQEMWDMFYYIELSMFYYPIQKEEKKTDLLYS